MGLLHRYRQTATIKRQVVTQSAGMGQNHGTPTTAARGTLPTSLDCRVMQPSAQERKEYGIQDVTVDDVLIFTTNPQVDNRDEITIGSDTLHVLTQRNPQRMSRFYIVECFRSDRGIK